MVRSLAMRWAAIFVAVLVAGLFVPRYVHYNGLDQVVVFAIVLALLNVFIRPIALMVTCPINLITLGLFTLVVNALFFWLAGSLVPAIAVNGFIGAFIGAFFVSVVSFIVNRIAK